MNSSNTQKRVESRLEVNSYIDKIKYAFNSDNVRLNILYDRKVDHSRDKRFSNRFTLSHLFPEEDVVKALKRELARLSVEEYIETVKDIRFPNKCEMRVFGRDYFGEAVYIKVRVELVPQNFNDNASFILVMSFHFSEWKFQTKDFPYKKV